MNLSKKLLLRLIGTTFLLSSAHAMDMPQEQSDEKIVIFYSAQEMLNFGHNIDKLIHEKRYTEGYQIARQNFGIQCQSLDMTDLEGFMFSRLYCLASYHSDIAGKSKLTPSVSIDQNLLAIDYIKDYLDGFENYISQHPSVNAKILSHRMAFYKKMALIYSQLAELHLPDNIHVNINEVDNTKNFYKEAITFYQKSINCMEEMTPKTPQEDLDKNKHQLLVLYTNLINVSTLEESIVSFNKAKLIHKGFKKANPPSLMVDESLVLLNTCETMIETKRIEVQSIGKSDKIQAIKRKKIEALNSQILETRRKGMKSTEHSLLPKTETILLFNQCLHPSVITDTPTVIQLLDKIEGNVGHLLGAANKPTQLNDVYQQLEVFLGANVLQNDFKKIMIASFLKTGKIKECLERLNILADLEMKKSGNISRLTQFFQAATPCLLGDNTKWLAFEAEMNQIKEKARLAKKKKKEEQNKQKIDQIRQAQQLAQKSEQNQKQVTKKEPVKITHETPDVLPDTFEELPIGNAREEKLLKKQRHEIAEKKRSEVEVTPPLAPIESTVPQIPLTDTPKETASIKDLYELTSTGKLVDDEIEGGTWQFTRDELITYFTCMGCVKKEGGRHKKLSLPSASIIMNGDTVVTVLNDIESAFAALGGALTLPRWDKSFNNGTVPHYLRDQILEARRKLVLLKLQENKR